MLIIQNCISHRTHTHKKAWYTHIIAIVLVVAITTGDADGKGAILYGSSDSSNSGSMDPCFSAVVSDEVPLVA